MPNPHVIGRLKGILEGLRAVHNASSPMSSASKGTERAMFVQLFLAQVLPTPFRSGTGDITDEAGARTGELDIVVEYPIMPSLPIPGATDLRLYLAEGVAAVIEVKSNLESQWDQVLSTAKKVAAIKRRDVAIGTVGQGPSSRIPFFAVGYEGWSAMETIQTHLKAGEVDGILQINPGLFASTTDYRSFGHEGPLSLWGLICCLHQATSALKIAETDPGLYAR